jgi:hypothetical protein
VTISSIPTSISYKKYNKHILIYGKKKKREWHIWKTACIALGTGTVGKLQTWNSLALKDIVIPAVLRKQLSVPI